MTAWASVCQASGAADRARHRWQKTLAHYEDLGASEAGQIRAKLSRATTATAHR